MTFIDKLDAKINELEPSVRQMLLTPPNDRMTVVVTQLTPHDDTTCDLCGTENLEPDEIVIGSTDRDLKIDLRTVLVTYVYVVCKTCRMAD